MGRILNLLLVIILIIVILFLFAPQLFAAAQNSLVKAINGAAANGQAQIVPQGNNSQLKLGGLSANSKYYVTLDQNQCGSSSFRDVGGFTTDKSGSGSTVLPTSSLSTQQIWFVNVHQGANDAGTSVACRQLDLTNSNATLPTTSDTGNSNVTFTIGTTGSSGLSNTSDTNTSNVNSVTSNDATNFYANGQEDQSASGVPQKGFPNTGVAPGGRDSYDNNTFPRKY